MGLFGGFFGHRYEMPDTSQWQMQNGLLDTGDQRAMQPEQGFWDGGDKFRGRDAIAGVLAAISDALAQQNGGRGSAIDMLAGGRMNAMELAQKAQAAQAQRQADLQDYEARKQIDQRYIAPDKPDEFTRHMQAAGIDPTSEQGRSLYRQHVMNMGDPSIALNLGGNRFYTGPRSGLEAALGGAGGPQPGTVDNGYRFKGGDPADQNNWEPVGGAGFATPRPFPPRRR